MNARFLLVLLTTLMLSGSASAQLFFEITNTRDSGPGSLREAIERANAECDHQLRCFIVAGIRDCAGQAPPRISLQSPLPPISARYLSLGTAVPGACRTTPPFLELDGSRLTSGNGVELVAAPENRPGTAAVYGLVINGFPENGILVRGSSRDVRIERNFIGTDATGERPIPNGLRGVAVVSPESVLYVGNNVISGNGRSGVFLWDAGVTDIVSNRIGDSASGQPLPNGASGIFIGPRTQFTSVARNFIRHHPQFGIAVAPPARFAEERNVFAGNQADVDVDLDGPSPNDDHETDGMLNAPELTDAVYDPVRDVTIVSGTLKTVSGVYAPNFLVDVKVASALGSIGFAVGATTVFWHDVGFVPPGQSFPIPFELEIRLGNGVGQYLTATTVAYTRDGPAPRNVRQTSEPSRPIRIR